MKASDEVVGIFHEEKILICFSLSSDLEMEVVALLSVKCFDIHG